MESVVRSQEKAFKRLRGFLRDAAKLCEERELKLVDACLVGSRARGDYLDESDIDVALIIGYVNPRTPLTLDVLNLYIHRQYIPRSSPMARGINLYRSFPNPESSSQHGFHI